MATAKILSGNTWTMEFWCWQTDFFLACCEYCIPIRLQFTQYPRTVALFFIAFFISGNVFVQRQIKNTRTSQQSGREGNICYLSVLFFQGHELIFKFDCSTCFLDHQCQRWVFHVLPSLRRCLQLYLWNPSWDPPGLFRLFTFLHNFQLFWLFVISPALFLRSINSWSWVIEAPLSYPRTLGTWRA